MFVNFTADNADSLKLKFRESAEQYRQQGVSFLVGDLEASQGAFQVCIKRVCTLILYLSLHNINIWHCEFGLSWQYFGLKENQVPLIVIQHNDGKKFLKTNVEPDHIATWLKAYKVMLISISNIYLLLALIWLGLYI